MRDIEQVRADLLSIFDAGLQCVRGDKAVAHALAQRNHTQACHVIAIGKAAEAMFLGARQHLGEQILSALVISKTDHVSDLLKQDNRVITLEAAHPVPDETSLQAGQQLIEYIAQLPENEPALILISGGASSLVEVLAEGWDLERLATLTKYLLANAYDIHEMNAIRKRISVIKGGKLWHYLGERSVECLMISDVTGDQPASIGSGLLFPSEEMIPERLSSEWRTLLPPIWDQRTVKARYEAFYDDCWEIVASNQLALNAMQSKAQALGYDVVIADEFLTGLAGQEANHCFKALQQASHSMVLWGAETMVNLPQNPGCGGRNQHFALSMAQLIHDSSQSMCWLAAGTDGSDGVSEDTGAIIDVKTIDRGELAGFNAADCLQQADSGTFLAASQDLIHTGATGTNVMDVVIGVKVLPSN